MLIERGVRDEVGLGVESGGRGGGGEAGAAGRGEMSVGLLSTDGTSEVWATGL